MKKWIVIFILVIIFSYINTYIKSKKENLRSYNFVVTKICKRSDLRLDIYDKKKLIIFQNFSFYIGDNIVSGDSISKPVCSDKLYIYEKDFSNRYKLKVTKSYFGDYPISLFCD